MALFQYGLPGTIGFAPGPIGFVPGPIGFVTGWDMGWTICRWSTKLTIPLGLVHILLFWAILLPWTIPLVMLHVTRCLGGFLSKISDDYLVIHGLCA
jgi:hypothetical protein